MMYREQKPQNKLFGLAKDYYRVRLLRIDEELPDDLAWDEDVLYKSPKAYPSRLKVTYRLQVLTPDNYVHEVAIMRNKGDSKKRFKGMEKDLNRLTKMEFDEKYAINVVPSTVVTTPLQENTIFFAGIERAPES